MELNSLINILLVINVIRVVVKADNANDSKLECHDNYTTINHAPIENITKECKDKICLVKCCVGLSTFLLKIGDSINCSDEENIRKKYREKLDKITLLEGDYERYAQKVEHDLKEFQIFYNSKLLNRNCTEGPIGDDYHGYVYQNNSLIILRDNYYHRFANKWDFGDFCYDHLILKENDSIHEPEIVFYYLPQPMEDIEARSEDTTYKSVLMSLSCVCLVLVFIVYWFIEDRRKMSIKIVLAYVTMFFGTFLLRVTMNYGLSSAQYRTMSAFFYFFTLSTFFWMTVMSLDIWWTCRGQRLSRPIHNKGVPRKFMWYCVYAWGVPMIVTGAVVYIDVADLSDQPHIYKPHFDDGLYVSDEDGVIEIRHYLYMPLAALLGVCTIFFLMTTYNIWRIKRNVDRFANEASKFSSNNSSSFLLYLKLSVVMGISWLLETIQLPTWLETIANVYNCSIGMAIFIIFICKRDVLLKLFKRLKIENACVAKLRRPSTVTTSTGSVRKRSAVDNNLSSAVSTTDTQIKRIST